MNRQEKIEFIKAIQNGTPLPELGAEGIHLMEHEPGSFVEVHNREKGYKTVSATELGSYINAHKATMGPYARVVITYHQEYKTISDKLEAEY